MVFDYPRDQKKKGRRKKREETREIRICICILIKIVLLKDTFLTQERKGSGNSWLSLLMRKKKIKKIKKIKKSLSITTSHFQ